MNRKIDIIRSLTYRLIKDFYLLPTKTDEISSLLSNTYVTLARKFKNMSYIIKLIDGDSLEYENILEDIEKTKNLILSSKQSLRPIAVSYFFMFSDETFSFNKSNLSSSLQYINKEKADISVTFVNSDTCEVYTEDRSNSLQANILIFAKEEYEKIFHPEYKIYTEEDIMLLIKDIYEKTTAPKSITPTKLNTFSITKIFILINVIIFILGLVLKEIAGGRDILFEYGAQQNLLVTHNYQLWRLITSMFLHADFLHLISNAYFLFVCGEIVEKFLGRTKFVIIYLVTGLAGNLLSLILLDQGTYSLGASGACLGLGGVILYLILNKKSEFRKHFRNMTSFAFIILFNVFYGFLLPGSNINNWAHLGGFIAGILMALFFA